MMTRRLFLASSAVAPLAAQTRKPNILLIVADDLGYAGIGVQGLSDIPTPHIDSIARNGVRFTSGYVSCPVCSPTRAGLMTGRYQQRFGHEFNPGPANQAAGEFGLPLSEATVADRLKSLGYATGMFGKWHLGYKPEYNPTKRGFDEFFGFPGGAHAYLDSKDRDRVGNPILRGTAVVEEQEYLTDALSREAAAFVDKHKEHPFFLYLPFNAVHAPMEAIEKYKSRFASISDERRRTHAAMMAAMDDAIGKVLGKLREHRIEDDTLIFFISDNGGPTAQTTSKNDPLRGVKGQTYEGGIRVPFLIQWKRRVPKNVVYDKPVISLDIHPTAVAAAGGQPAANVEGVNLIPFVTGQNKGVPHDALYWRFGQQWAVRKGDFKLVQSSGNAPQLFNLTKDIGEANDLSESDRAHVSELLAAWQSWNLKNVEPKWRTQRLDGKKGGRKKGKKKRN
jgi:arylsulfatase A-like enzyme